MKKKSKDKKRKRAQLQKLFPVDEKEGRTNLMISVPWYFIDVCESREIEPEAFLSQYATDLVTVAQADQFSSRIDVRALTARHYFDISEAVRHAKYVDFNQS